MDEHVRWYSDKFGLHFHPDVWPRRLGKHVHRKCRKVWPEGKDFTERLKLK